MLKLLTPIDLVLPDLTSFSIAYHLISGLLASSVFLCCLKNAIQALSSVRIQYILTAYVSTKLVESNAIFPSSVLGKFDLDA